MISEYLDYDITTVFEDLIIRFLSLIPIKPKMNSSNILNNSTVWELGRSFLDLTMGLYRKRIAKMTISGLISRDSSIIDIGCGTGQYSKIASGKYLGIDLNPKYIDYCNKKYANKNKSFRCSDVSSLLDEKLKFDIVLMVDFLHHLPDESTIKILNTASKLANKYIVCFEPILEQDNFIGKWIINHDRGDHIRTLDNLHKLFTNVNLEIMDSFELNLGPIKTRAIFAIPR